MNIIDIKTNKNVTGTLSYFEAQRDIGFEIKRIYYIYDVPQNVTRGFHAHKKLKQLLFCVHGAVMINTFDGITREEVILDAPNIGIVLESNVWRTMTFIRPDSVLCVAASEYYDETDYIRDYNKYLQYLTNE